MFGYSALKHSISDIRDVKHRPTSARGICHLSALQQVGAVWPVRVGGEEEYLLLHTSWYEPSRLHTKEIVFTVKHRGVFSFPNYD